MVTALPLSLSFSLDNFYLILSVYHYLCFFYFLFPLLFLFLFQFSSTRLSNIHTQKHTDSLPLFLFFAFLCFSFYLSSKNCFTLSHHLQILTHINLTNNSQGIILKTSLMLILSLYYISFSFSFSLPYSFFLPFVSTLPHQS